MKSRTTRRELEITIGEESLEGLKKLSDADVAEFGFFRSGESGFTIGRSLDYGEHEGKGLPEWKNDKQLFVELNIKFVVRVTCDREGTTYLEIAQDGHQSFYSFPFKGIDYRDLFSIVPKFEERLSRFLIHFGIYPLFSALYRAKESDQKKRSEVYDSITKKFDNFFKNILKAKTRNGIEVIEQDGLKITSYNESIKVGRHEQPEEEIEMERLEFLKNVFKAFRELDKKKITGPKQKDLTPYIFSQYADREKKISETLTKHHLKFKDLWQKYLTNRTLEAFLSAVNSER